MRALSLSLLVGALATTAQLAAQTPDTTAALSALRELKVECERDSGRLWGMSLCGPVVLVHPTTRTAVTNAPDPAYTFVQRDGGMYVGRLPDSVWIANTAVEWGAKRWTMVMFPLPRDTFDRIRLLAHESFHRIQPQLGIAITGPFNSHLDERDGRLWLRLEMRAMLRAIAEPNADSARSALSDALTFRAYRNQLYPGSDTLEALLERGEGLAEYTGIRVAMASTGLSTRGAAEWTLRNFERMPSFVRSLGYGSGPLLGLSLDRFDDGWRKRAASIVSLSRELAASMHFYAHATNDEVLSRAARYDFATLVREEDARAADRAARVADYRKQLMEGPVLILRQSRVGGAFNPNTIVPLGADGTVFPRRRFESEWGALDVTEGGGLVAPDHSMLRVRAPQTIPAMPASVIHGPGWTLELKAGWIVRPGARTGDFEVVAQRP